MKKKIIFILTITIASLGFLTLNFNIHKSKERCHLKGKILFRRSNNSYLMSISDAKVEEVEVLKWPIVSLNAKKVAWVIEKHSKQFDGNIQEIVITNIDGKNKQVFEIVEKIQLGKEETLSRGRPPWIWGLIWAEDEKSILFYYRKHRKENSEYYAVSLDISNGEITIIKELFPEDISHDRLKNTSYGVVSPNGKKIATSNGSNIYVANIDGENRQNITNYKYPSHIIAEMAGRGGYEDPSWSPDGRYVSCCYIKKIGIGFITKNSYEIWAIDTISGKKICLTEGTRPMWLPEEFDIPKW